ncbi:MAG: M20/M25/M40 family metallo-hydrolase [Candidatus Eisenbacteria bacterium]|nr:M20/M25/M40 family metallo-hydrolase [Candidatus Eisenbacteria bacterium]
MNARSGQRGDGMRTVTLLFAAVLVVGLLAGGAPAELYAVRFRDGSELSAAERLGATVRLIGAGSAVVESDGEFAGRALSRGLSADGLGSVRDGETPVVWYPGSTDRTPSVGRVLWSDRVGTHLVAAGPEQTERLRAEAHQVVALPDAIDTHKWFDPAPPSHVIDRRTRGEEAWRGVVNDVLSAVSGDSLMAMTRRLSETTGGDPRTRFVFHDACLDEAKPAVVSALESCLPPGSPIEYQRFDLLGYTCEGGSGGPAVDYPVENIIATLEGNGRLDGAYIVCGHYDATASSSAYDDSFAFWWCQHDAPGADDNATGVATVLEVARVIAASGLEFPFDIRFVLFTAEELGLIGSEAYADSIAAAGDTVYAAINVDMIAFKPHPANPDTCHLVTNESSAWLADWMLETVDAYPAHFPSFSAVRIDTPLLYSDHGSFWVEGYDALVAIEHWSPRDRNPYYHTIGDRFSTIRESQFASTTRAVAGAIARLADPEAAFNLAVFPGGIQATPNRPFTGAAVDVELDVHAFGPDTLAAFTIELWDGEPDGGELLAAYDVDRTVGSGEVVTRTFTWALEESDVGDHTLTARVVVEDAPEELSISDNTASTILNVRAEGPIGILRHHVARNPATSLDDAMLVYELSREVQLVEVEVYDVTGQQVFTHTIRERGQGLSAGLNQVSLASMTGEDLASGVYIYRLRVVARDRSSTDDVATGKFALVR